MKLIFAFLLSLSCALTAQAQVGNCPRALGEAYLDINNVRARIVNTGGLFYRGEPHVYNVPKRTESNAIFASGIWVGGMVNNSLRVSASRYGEWEMWGGPLDEQGNPPADCAAYDRIYKISIPDILEYEATGFATPDLRDWPVELGAPVVDGDGIPDNYDLDAGDRPEILGHQTLWWVMNDRGNVHESTDTEPIGLEVQVTAFAAESTNPAINNTTFFKYKLIYRGETPLTDAYFGIFSDPDLGDFADDYVGSDTTNHLGYVYNADNEDLSRQGYGTPPPATGYRFLKGATADADSLDNDLDGIIDEPGEHLGMTSFLYYNGGGGITEDPVFGMDYYLYMQSRWKDGRSVKFGGDGFETGVTDTETRFMYSGDPETGEGWSEVNPGTDGSLPPNTPADRRFVLSTGPFNMQPGEMEEITFAVVWAKGENNLNSVTALKAASVAVRDAYENGFNIPVPTAPAMPPHLLAPANGAAGQSGTVNLYWQPVGDFNTYQLQWASSPTFLSAGTHDFLTRQQFELTDLHSDSTYYWRVRSVNSGGYSPWSEAWQFSTSSVAQDHNLGLISGFMAIQNAAGPIDPPDMAAFAFNNSGFPVLEGNLTPAGSYPDPLQPTPGIQQATSDAVWGIHTGGQGRIFYGDNCLNNNEGCHNTFIGRSLRSGWTILGMDNFEWRFTQACLDGINGTVETTDCLAFRRFEDDAIVEVPFEIWNVGQIDNPDDDYQLIPAICESACSENDEDTSQDFGFSIGGDHDISDGDDDPFSDWVYWYKPRDLELQSGSLGYQEFFNSDSLLVGDEVMARTVLVLLDGGNAPPYTATWPEPNTIFRIANRGTLAPVQAAPLSGATDLTQPVTLYWNGRNSPEQLQVSLSPEFSNTVIDSFNTGFSTITLPVLERNQTYFWRVRLASKTHNTVLSDWSPTWQFSVSNFVVSTESDDRLPTEFALEANYPNPFNHSTTIRYALPREAEVRLEVYDLLGRRVRVIASVHQPAGWHEALFDASGLTSGTYFYRLSAEGFTQTRSMILLK